MKTQLLRPADYRTMPWKNGRGITHEIAAARSAEDEGTGRFTWRLSMAEVASSAPFSEFNGYDRTIVLLDGDGMVLERGAAGRHVLDQKFVPYEFPGEWSIDGQLLGGACRDFNVIVDRRRCSARVTVLTLSSDMQRVTIERPIAVLFGLSGTFLASIDATPETHVMSAHDTLLCRMEDEPLSGLHVQARDDEAKLLFIEFAEK